MHKLKIRPDVEERILKRRGQLHVHATLDPARTALVVIDMQRAFVDPALPSAVPVAREIVPNINRLADVFRKRGSIVAWVYTTFTATAWNSWSAFFGGIYSREFSAALSRICHQAATPRIVRRTQYWLVRLACQQGAIQRFLAGCVRSWRAT